MGKQMPKEMVHLSARIAAPMSSLATVRTRSLRLRHVEPSQDSLRSPNPDLIQVLQHVSRILINTVSAGLLEFFLTVAAREQSDA